VTPVTVSDTIHIPTDPTALADLLVSTPTNHWWDLQQTLAAQLGDKRAEGLFDAAENQALHHLNITAARQELQQALRDALDGVQRAAGSLGELTSNEIYDVEYADGAQGADLRALLADAGLLLRSAHAINQLITRDQ